jgi:hypothetical protein
VLPRRDRAKTPDRIGARRRRRGVHPDFPPTDTQAAAMPDDSIITLRAICDRSSLQF